MFLDGTYRDGYHEDVACNSGQNTDLSVSAEIRPLATGCTVSGGFFCGIFK